MSDFTRMNVYDSQSEDYRRAFQVFLDHTDQKEKAREWLDRLVERLPSRNVFVDAGAGSGKVTGWFLPHFRRTIAIEPNTHFCEELRRTCPTAEVLPETIMAASVTTPASFVLCSHVFGYIDRAEWLLHLEKLASWLAPGGVLIVAMQNQETDCMRMRHHFCGQQFGLSELAATFQATRGERYNVELETVAAHIVTADFDTAYTVAEFLLNPNPAPPARHELEAYIRTHGADPAGGFRFSCHQDFLQIRPLG